MDYVNQKDIKPLALVTGASRGIGEAIAEGMAKEGYDLILTCSNSLDELQAVAERLEKEYGVTCESFQVDGSNSEAVKCFFSQPVGDNRSKLLAEKSIDVLINNAGVSYVGLLHEMSDEAWRHVMGANLDAAFYFCREVIPGMIKKQAGNIINISSVWGNVGASMEVAYSASKGGINTLTKALAKELAPSGIKVNAVACGLIDTRMNACFSKEDLASVIEEIPADRIGQPAEVAQVVKQLIGSPSYLTGQIVTLDGGWT